METPFEIKGGRPYQNLSSDFGISGANDKVFLRFDGGSASVYQ